MMLLDRSIIHVGPRQRSEIPKDSLLELRRSILERGLLHPPVFRLLDDGKWELVAGQRRLSAIDLIASENETFLCNGEIIPPGKVPATSILDSNEEEAFISELEENLIRVDLSWQDRNRALAKLHSFRKEQNPKQTFTDTANEIVAKYEEGSAPSPISIKMDVSRAAVIAQHLHRPEINKARNAKEAYRLILNREHAEYEAELLRRKAKNDKRSLVTIRQGNSMEILPTLDEGMFDLILTDPPYGISAGNAGARSRTVHHHNYEDTPEYAREILRVILTESFRITKLKANIFIFTDMKNFDWLCTFASQMGWVPWKYPIIWQKSEAEGLVPWGRQGFARTYEIIFWATKGQRGIRGPHIDILNFSRVQRHERTYAAEKPVDLLKKLIELSTLPGDKILDPCVGSGSTMVAAKVLNRHGIGIELDPAIADLATVRLSKGETEFDKQMEFEYGTPQELPLDTGNEEISSIPPTKGVVDLGDTDRNEHEVP